MISLTVPGTQINPRVLQEQLHQVSLVSLESHHDETVAILIFHVEVNPGTFQQCLEDVDFICFQSP